MVPKNISLFDPLVNLDYEELPLRFNDLFCRRENTTVEIGFGRGEVITRSALSRPACNFIGIEQHWGGIYKTLKRIDSVRGGSSTIENIRILRVDARDAFERVFNKRSIDEIICLFPCPWPKKGHVKHRLFSKDFFVLLNSRLKSKGSIKIVTDYLPYLKWIKSQIPQSAFDHCVETTKPTYDTKYERKWLAQGQKKFYELKLTKKKHLQASSVKVKKLKTYQLKKCDPKNIRPKNITGDIAVIFKDYLHDQEKERTIIQTIISEGHLTQYFWISVRKKGEHWLISKAEGQKFFPTPGIAKALEVVCEAAKKSLK